MRLVITALLLALPTMSNAVVLSDTCSSYLSSSDAEKSLFDPHLRGFVIGSVQGKMWYCSEIKREMPDQLSKKFGETHCKNESYERRLQNVMGSQTQFRAVLIDFCKKRPQANLYDTGVAISDYVAK
jgi:hypothetical protein